jgi:hypothetical protein
MWTNLEGFNHLHATELAALLDAPALITVLVGAADGVLDREERNWSDRLMRARTYNNPKHLNDYYTIIANGFLEKVDKAMDELPVNVEVRSTIIAQKLTLLNPVLAKLDDPLGADLYKSYIGLAEETAKASGGFLRIGAISAEEARWIGLPMLTPLKGASTPVEWDEKDPEVDQ